MDVNVNVPVIVTGKSDDFNSQTTIVQPNNVTFAQSSFTRTQIQIFAYVMKELQCFITPQLAPLKERDMAALEKIQLSLFTEIEGVYLLDLPKKFFVKSKNYAKFREELVALSRLSITYRKRNPKTGKISNFITNIFSIYENNEVENDKLRNVTLEIRKETLNVLCNISLVADPKNALYYLDYYTNYTFEVLQQFKKKYTGLLYLYLSSWKSKGGWIVPTKDLRSYLGLPDNKYKADRDLKSHVLMVAREEMISCNSPIWFEVAFVGAQTRFKILTRERQSQIELHRSSVIDLLKRMHCSTDQINSIRVILEGDHFDKLREIILRCNNEINDPTRRKAGNEVRDPALYTIGAIKKWYAQWKKLEL